MNTVFRFWINQVQIDLNRRVYHHHDRTPHFSSFKAISTALARGKPIEIVPTHWSQRPQRLDASDWPVNNIWIPLRQLTWRVLRRRNAKALSHFPNVVLQGPR